MTVAISVDSLTKQFRIHHERNQSLKSAIMRGRVSSYEDFKALDNVNLEINQGTSIALIGGNGSGKSTLLKCLAKIYRPTSGTITHNGRMAALLEVGSGFHPELSGKDNIYLNGSILGMSRKEIDQKIDKIIEFSGVEKFIDQPVKNYSSGMYVRLGFSVAIHVDPEILVVDEVLAVGDAAFQKKCFQKFHDFKQEGRTIVLVSHSMDSVREICDSAAWLSSGKIKEIGDVNTVTFNYEASVA